MKYAFLYFIGTLLIPLSLYANKKSNNLHDYFWANYYQHCGDFNKAASCYTQLFSNQAPQYVYKGYIGFLFETGNLKKIVDLIPSLEQPFAQDPDMQLIFAKAFEGTGNQLAAYNKIITLARTFKTHQEIIFQAAQVYMARLEPENALKVIDDFLNASPRKPTNFIFHFLKSQICIALNNLTQAAEQINVCLEINKEFDKGWLLYATLKEQQGSLDEAIRGYTSFLHLTGSNQEVEQHLLALTVQQKKLEHSHNFQHKTSFEKALVLHDRKQHRQALQEITKFLEKNSTHADARLLKINILSALEQHAQAANTLKKWIAESPQDPLWFTTLHLLCHQGLPYQKAIAILEDVAHTCPQSAFPLLYLADIHMRLGNSESALSYHTKSLERTQDAQLKTKILFYMGFIYYEQKQYELMRTTLEKGLALNTNFLPLLNLLAYYYATKGKELGKAQQLMDTVLAVQKNNPHYLDTQALIYYKQQEFEKAIALLQEAQHKAPNDTVIVRHLAKAYYKLGNKDKAHSMIQHALTLAHYDHEKTQCIDLFNAWNIKK